MKRSIYTLILLLFHFSLLAQIPNCPNKTDKKGNPIGLWRYNVNSQLNEADTAKGEKPSFYRVADYGKKGKLSKKITDYHPSGKLANIGYCNGEDPFFYEGLFSGYSEKGGISVYAYFVNNKEDSIKTLEGLTEYATSIEPSLGTADSLYILYASVQVYKSQSLKAFGRYQESIDLLEYAAKTIEKASNGKPIEEMVDFYANLSGFYSALSQYNKAADNIKKSINIMEQLGDTLSLNFAGSINNYGEVLRESLRFDEALQQYKRCEGILIKTIGTNNPYYGVCCNNIATLFAKQSKYKEALGYILKAVELRRNGNGPLSLEYANSLRNLANVYMLLGEFQNTDKIYQELLNIHAHHNDQSSLSYLHTLYNYGHFFSKINNEVKAMSIMKAAIEAYEKHIKIPNEFYYTMLMSYIEVAKSRISVQDWGKLIEKAEAGISKLTGINHPSYADILEHKAVYFAKLGIIDSAIQCVNESKKIDFALFGPKGKDAMLVYNNLAMLHYYIKDMHKSIFYSDSCMLIAKDLGIEYTLDAILFRQNQAVHLGLMKNHARAIASFDSTFNALSVYTDLNYRQISQEERLQLQKLSEEFISRFANYVHQNLKEKPELGGMLFNYLLRSQQDLKNIEAQIISSIENSSDAHLLAKLGEMKSLKEQYAQTAKSKDADKNQKLNELSNKVRNLEIDIAASVGFTLKEQRKSSWKDIKEKLKPTEAYVEIFMFTNDGVHAPDSMAYAFILRPDKEQPIVVKLNKNNQFFVKDFKYYSSCIELEILDKSSYNIFWKPIKNELAGIEKVYFTPFLYYHHINLNTLYNTETKKHLLDEMTIELIGGGMDLLQKRVVNTSSKTAYLFGNPTFNGSKNDGGKTDRSVVFNNLSQLPATKIEVDDISSQLREKSWEIKVFSEDQANETELKKINNPRILHIASHGFHLNETQLQNADYIFGYPTVLVRSNNNLRSGVLLSGAGLKKNETEIEDGVITALEAQNLNLLNTELVILSACETGIGNGGNGSQYGALTRAFLAAGSRSVLSSLWKVDDKATQLLMSSFYKHWLKSGDKKEAFLFAQKEVKKVYPQPKYWGAFIMTGN